MEVMTECPKVLVIDDERGPRESLRILLKTKYNVLCADCVDAGVELLKQENPDVIIMDIRMPGKSGIDGLGEIRGIDNNISVIMLTGFGSLETAQKAMRLGANDYIKKPFDTQEMEDVINRNIERTKVERLRWQAENDLEKYNQQLTEELAQKAHMADLGQKSAELMHDIRSPLSTILGYLELLEEDLEESKAQLGDRWPETSKSLDMIQRGANRCKDLAEMWLSIGKQGKKKHEPFHVHEVLHDVVKDLNPEAEERKVQLKLQYDQTSRVALGDALQFSRALQNVISNSIDAVLNDTGKVNIECQVTDHATNIIINDNGCGMSEDQIMSAFQPFVSNKDKKGTGLGLFIAKKVIEDHYGTISISSKVDEGTRVNITVPICEKDAVKA